MSVVWQKPFRGTQVNRSHPIARNLLAAWVMNEGTGNKVFDLSRNGNDGTFDSTNPPSWQNLEIDFDDTNQEHIDITSPSKDLVDLCKGSLPYTLFLIGKIDAHGASENLDYPIFGWYGDAGDFSHISLRKSWGTVPDRIRLTNRDNYSYTTIESNAISIGVDERHSYALTHDGNNGVNYYYDGQGVGSGTGGNWPDVSTTHMIGWSNISTDEGFDGRMEVLYLFTRKLSAGEILLLNREPYCFFVQPSIERYLYIPSVGDYSVDVNDQASGADSLTNQMDDLGVFASDCAQPEDSLK